MSCLITAHTDCRAVGAYLYTYFSAEEVLFYFILFYFILFCFEFKLNNTMQYIPLISLRKKKFKSCIYKLVVKLGLISHLPLGSVRLY